MKKWKKKTILWVAVTEDELQLPIAVTDTSIEMAEYFGVTQFTLRRWSSEYKAGLRRYPRVISVRIEGEEDAERMDNQ